MSNDVSRYSSGSTGKDKAGDRSEKPVTHKGLPQRGTQPDLDLSPEGDDYYESRISGENFYTNRWKESTGSSANDPLDHEKYEPNNYYTLPYSERKVGDKPQDFRGSKNPFKPGSDDAFFTSGSVRFGKNTMEDYGDVGANELNHPVKQRRSIDFYGDGYKKEPYEAIPSGSSIGELEEGDEE